jgi:hypothetical protein
MNRLDEICGPQGWTTEYTATPHGQKCRLKILCPDHTADGYAWHYKDDGAGREDMGRTTREGEWETNEDDSEKAAYTNAFRRAAHMWGFGREQYMDGVPNWIADLHVNAPTRSAEARTATYPPSGQRGHDFSPPAVPGKAMFAWIMRMEEKYQANKRLLDAVTTYCKSHDLPSRTDQLDEEGLKMVGQYCVSYIKSWPEYDGIFGDTNSPPRQNTSAPVADPTMALKLAIVASVKSWLTAQYGRETQQPEVIAAITELAATAVSGTGHKGEIMTSLKDCTDKVWLQNILKESQNQLQRTTYLHSPVGGLTPGVFAPEFPW